MALKLENKEKIPFWLNLLKHMRIARFKWSQEEKAIEVEFFYEW